MATDSVDGQDSDAPSIGWENIARRELAIRERERIDELRGSVYLILEALECGESVDVEELEDLRSELRKVYGSILGALEVVDEISSDEIDELRGGLEDE